MRTIRITKTIFNLIFISFIINGNAFAQSELSIIESKVISTPTHYGRAIYTLTGPENIQYRIVAAPTEVQRIQNFAKANPNSVVRFSGTVDDLDGTKVFRVGKWEEINKTTPTD